MRGHWLLCDLEGMEADARVGAGRPLGGEALARDPVGSDGGRDWGLKQKGEGR